ncbi:NAD(P)H-dependent oxidoreductase [Frankia gtarii]|uniref:NAD(P)H-dependent oxidoreductase n=1 Tax=Frankia gtarii TaxID=2950102 RepID=UPI0021C0A22A|nr:NAD(P)H-dependent oxidoreductase [Frankia gtarii]
MIIGSVREGRTGTAIATWFVDQARAYGLFDVDVVDPAGIDGGPLPSGTPVPCARTPPDAHDTSPNVESSRREPVDRH